jgi:UV DNA damage endonuclease
MIRLGLCCKFSKEPIRFRTTTATYLKKLALNGTDPKIHLSEIIKHNVTSLEAAITYCSNNHIGSFRIGSDFLPSVTHPDVKYTLNCLPDGAKIKSDLIKCKKLAERKNIRLTFHPSQFVILNSPNEQVVQNAIEDLEYHSALAELVGADVINIHVGGAYDDKASALKRFEENFVRLSKGVQKRLTLENDDKTYCPAEVLPLCQTLNIPFVYDVHHHRCHPDNLSIDEATDKALKTWDREPLFHISSPLEGWGNPKPFRHHDFIDPNDFPKYWKSLENLTIEIEAKAKEIAIEKIYQHLEKEIPLS